MNNDWQQYLDGSFLSYASSEIWNVDDVPVPVLFFNIKEKLFEPYRIEAVIVINQVLDNTCLGQPLCIGLGGSNAALRIFSGILFSFQFEGVSVPPSDGDDDNGDITVQYIYRIIAYPSLQTLGYDSQLRIFENTEKRKIVTQLLSNATIEFNSNLVMQNQSEQNSNSSSSNPTPNTVSTQYNEKTLDYIVRLLQECGVIAYFDASDYICDDPDEGVEYDTSSLDYQLSENWSNCTSFDLNFDSTHIGGYGFDAIIEFKLTCSSLTNDVQIFEYNFQTPSVQVTGQATNSSWINATNQLYPTNDTNSQEANTRAANITHGNQTRAYKFEATTSGYRAYPGAILNVGNCTATYINNAYYIEEVEHVLENIDGEWIYRNHIKGVLETQSYIPEITKIKPKIHGYQTAVVVGTTENTQLNFDEYGRVQVRFVWIHGDSSQDISSNITSEPSIWVRVMQWGQAGNNWGNVSLPRVGQEVVVSFLNGDPDHPIVLGSVFNSANTFPLSMPSNAGTLVMKTQTLGDAGKTGLRYNEFSMCDAELDEQVYLRAQNNAKVEVFNDWSRDVYGNEVENIVGLSVHTFTIGSRYERFGLAAIVPGQEALEATLAAEMIGGTADVLTMTKGVKMLHICEGAYLANIDLGDITFNVPKGTINLNTSIYIRRTTGDASALVGGGYFTRVAGDNSLKVVGDYNVTVGGIYSNTIDGVFKTSVTGDYNLSTEGLFSMNSVGVMNIEATGALSLTGAADVNIKGATVNIEAGEINLTGGMISAESGGVFDIEGSTISITGALIQLG